MSGVPGHRALRQTGCCPTELGAGDTPGAASGPQGQAEGQGLPGAGPGQWCHAGLSPAVPGRGEALRIRPGT